MMYVLKALESQMEANSTGGATTEVSQSGENSCSKAAATTGLLLLQQQSASTAFNSLSISDACASLRMLTTGNVEHNKFLSIGEDFFKRIGFYAEKVPTDVFKIYPNLLTVFFSNGRAAKFIF